MNPPLFHPVRWLAVIVLLLVFAAPRLGRAADAQGFYRGNQRYAAGDFAGAARAYEEAVHEGRFSANLFSNLGDAYYRVGDKGRAILNYRRSLLLDPSQAEAAANLAFVNGGKTARDHRGFGWIWEIAPWLAAAGGWLGVAGLLVAVADRRFRPLGIGLAAAGFFVGATTAGLAGSFDGGAGVASKAVVVAEATPALYSPADNSKVVTTLAAGGEVRVLSEQGAWIYALLGDDKTRAWLASDKVERLVPPRTVLAQGSM